MKKNVGLFFGSFNPIHIGHLCIAHYMSEYTDMDEVWFVVSPQSPFKQKKSLLDQRQRYYMAQLATEKYPKLRVSDVEFTLPQPSYTVTTLEVLKEKFPDFQFSLIMGMDNMVHLHKWRNYEAILKEYSIYVYPRIGENEAELLQHPSVHLTEAPIIQMSSSFIRKSIQEGKNIQPFVSDAVFEYLDSTSFYQ